MNLDEFKIYISKEKPEVKEYVAIMEATDHMLAELGVDPKIFSEKQHDDYLSIVAHIKGVIDNYKNE